MDIQAITLQVTKLILNFTSVPNFKPYNERNVCEYAVPLRLHGIMLEVGNREDFPESRSFPKARRQTTLSRQTTFFNDRNQILQSRVIQYSQSW